MFEATALNIAETFLRVAIGVRFLSAGLRHVRSWPDPVRTAGLVFPVGTWFFGLVATALMIAGGLGLVLGFQTPIAASMIVVFLIPTFLVHRYWLRTLPESATKLKSTLDGDQNAAFRVFERHAIQFHEEAARDNFLILAAALFLAFRGSVALSFDTLMSGRVFFLH